MIKHNIDFKKQELQLDIGGDVTSTTVDDQHEQLKELFASSDVWAQPWQTAIFT